MAMSLEHRGFGAGVKRTVYQRLRGGRVPFTHFIISAIIAATLLFLPYAAF
jgi:energy-coupling factor transporter transmembrane protein EcfT